MDNKVWKYVIWVIIVLWVMAVLGMGIAITVNAQVTPGTVFSKTEDGVGNKITSTVVGPSRGLDVNVIAGGGSSGVPYLDADGIVNQTTTAIHGQTYMYNGATWDRVRGDTTNGVWVNCKNGCAGGSSTPTDAFANPTTAGLQMDFLMGYNGATWDRLRESIANGLVVDVSRVQGNVTVITSDGTATGTITNTQSVVIATAGFSTVGVDISGVWTGSLTPEVTVNGSAWYPVNFVDTGGGLLGLTWAANNLAQVNVGGMLQFRVRGNTVTSGTATITLRAMNGPSVVALNESLPQGANQIGNIGTVTSITNPVTVSGTVGVSNAFLLDATFTGRWTAASLDADAIANETTTSVHGKCYLYNGATWDRCRGAIGTGLLVNISNATLAVTQSGTWNIGTVTSITNAVAVTNAGLTNLDVALSTRLADSTFTGRFAAAYLDADAIANQTTTAVHGQTYLYNGASWDRARGTTANGMLVDVSRITGNVTVVQGTGTNLHMVCDSGCTPGGSFADSSAFTFASTAINNMGAVVDDVATNTVAENSAGAPRMNTNRILYEMSTNSSGVALYPTATVEADAIANPTLTQISTFLHGYNGATWDRLRSSTANGLVVDVSRVQGNVAVTNAGLTNIDVALSTRLADATFTGRFAAAFLDADGIANQTTTAIHGFEYMYNGASWDRVRGAAATGLLVNISNGSLAVTGSLGRTWVLASGTDSVTVTSITNPLPAGTNLLGQVIQGVQSGAVQTFVGYATSSTSLLSTSTVRQTAVINNRTSVQMCVALGAIASLNTCDAIIPPGGNWSVPVSVTYRGPISGRWFTSGWGEAIITDIPGG